MTRHATRETVAEEQPFHLGDRIRKAREYVGQDRQTFAETIGVHRDTLAKYEETGKAKRSVLISIAWHTPVRLEWLERGELPWINPTESDRPEKKRPVNGLKQSGSSAITTGPIDIRTRRPVEDVA